MDIQEKMRAELKAARDIAAKAEAEGRDLTPEEVTDAATHLKAYEAAKAEFQKGKESDSLKASLAAIGMDLGLEQNEPQQKAGAFLAPSRGKSLGQLFVESAQYVGFMKAHGDRIPGDRARVQSEPMGLKGIFPNRKALVTGSSDTSGGAFVNPDITGIYEALGRPKLTARDLISVRQTGSDTVEFVRQLTQPNSAAPVPEATTADAPTSGGTAGPLIPAAGGGYKPEGSISFQKVTETVKTIAEWIPATKRGIADAAQLRGLIDDELLADLAQTEEDQILNGDGTGENFRGILETTGIQAQAYSATVTDLDPLLETTLKARTKVLVGGRAVPTGYMLNPLDWERIQLARLAKNPQNEAITAGVPTLHGLPVVESENIAQGVGLVGDFRKAILWDREQASISITDSHADFFIRNLVAILAEERAAFGVTRPAAFVEIDLTAA
ncbi:MULTISPECIES: phage major capsid protein [unclassified Microbacterium]|uniref:phage major capsid protein n=1 Tax=Microbacterium TaxID=33882 RepID=UPI003BA1707F